MNYFNVENPMIAAAQRQMDEQAIQDERDEERWTQVWDEIDAAVKSGAMSLWVAQLAEKAIEKHGELPEEVEPEPDYDAH